MVKQGDNGFHVKLDGIELSDAAIDNIQKGIQEVVLRELAKHTPHKVEEVQNLTGISAVVPSIYWRGLWIYLLKGGLAGDPAGKIGVIRSGSQVQ
jgi:hypothetical protein